MKKIFMRYKGGLAKALTLSYDDAVQQDARLIEIMKSHGLKGTFNINSGAFTEEGTVFSKNTIHRRMTKKEVYELFAGSGQEVAVHGLTHPWLDCLPTNICVKEIMEDRENLEEMFGTIVRGMAYPYGAYNDAVVQVLADCQIAYARTVNATGKFQIPTDWLRLNPTCHHDDADLFELADRFLTETPKNQPWLFYLWGHSYEFEAHDNWNRIEEFADRMSGKEDIWYATNIEIYDYVKAFEQLIFDNAMKKVYNPTDKTLYMKYGDTLITIPSGATVQLTEER